MTRRGGIAKRVGGGGKDTLFLAIAIANQGAEAETLEQQLSEQVARIVTDGVTDREMEKARNDFRASHVFGMQTSMQIAERIQHYVHYHESLDEIHTDLKQYLAVTPADIQRVAAKYLVPANSYTITIVPKQSAEEVVP